MQSKNRKGITKREKCVLASVRARRYIAEAEAREKEAEKLRRERASRATSTKPPPRLHALTPLRAARR